MLSFQREGEILFLKTIAILSLLTLSMAATFAAVPDENTRKSQGGGGDARAVQLLSLAKSAPLYEIGFSENRIRTFRDVVQNANIIVVDNNMKPARTIVFHGNNLGDVLADIIAPRIRSKGDLQISVRFDAEERLKRLNSTPEFKAYLTKNGINSTEVDSVDLLAAAIIETYSRLIGEAQDETFVAILRYRVDHKTAPGHQDSSPAKNK